MRNIGLLVGIVGCLSFAPALAQADIIMLPPTPVGSAAVPGTTGACSTNQLLTWTGTNAGGQSGINCIGNFVVDGSGNTTVSGTATFNNSVTINGSSTLNGNSYITGAQTISGFLTVNPGGIYLGSYPSGWGGGIHTWDVYAEGSLGVGTGGTLTAYLTRTGDIFANNSITVNGVSSFNNNMTINASTVSIDNAAHNAQLCLNGNCVTTLSAGGALAFGGIFEQETTAGGAPNGCKPNPATGGCSCPPGYNQHYIHWNNTGGANNQYNQYMCTNP